MPVHQECTNGDTWGNPTAAVDEETNKVWLFMSWNAADRAQNISPAVKSGEKKSINAWGHRKLFSIHSCDDGRSWGNLTDLTEELVPKDCCWDAVGPGVGVQTKVIAPGRLIVPAIGRNIFSNDHGKTWQYEKLPPGTSEGTIVELNDGTLLRNDRATKKMWEEKGKRRMLARGSISLTDSSWEWKPCDELLDPRCQASALAFTNSGGERHILFLNSASTETRMKTRLRCSTDNGCTWATSWCLYDTVGCPKPKGKPLKGVGAYSSLAMTADGTITALVEKEEEDGACSVSLVAFQLMSPAQCISAQVYHTKVHMFANPVVPYNRPDPGVNYIGGCYYLVSTGKAWNAKGWSAFPLLRSSDLVTWEELGTVFLPGGHPSWSANTDFWAPEIHQVANGKIHVYFTARDGQGALHVGVAVADSPLGPYVDLGRPLVSDPHWAIDGSYFLDAETGRQYLLWKIDGNAHKVRSVIKMCELGANGTERATGAIEHCLISSDQPWEHGVVEGPWLLRRGSYHYLFFSGGCYAKANYCVAVARSTSLTGPYQKCGAPVLCSGKGFAGPGHCVVVPTPTGGDVMVYHSHRSSQMQQVDLDDFGGMCRVVLVDCVTWHEDGWPRVGKRGTPTFERQPSILEPSVAITAEADALCVGRTYHFSVIGNSSLALHYNGEFREGDRDYIHFTVRQGLCPGGTISLEATNAVQSGTYLRHCNGQLFCDIDDGSELFAKDATWQVLPGMSGNDTQLCMTVSLRSINFPLAYVMCSATHIGQLGAINHADLRCVTLVAAETRLLSTTPACKFLTANHDGSMLDLSQQSGERQSWKFASLGELFTIEIVGGVEGTRRYLSANHDGSIVDLWHQVGQRQQWRLRQKGAFFTIEIAGGVCGARRYMSTNGEASAVYLWHEAGAKQQWALGPDGSIRIRG